MIQLALIVAASIALVAFAVGVTLWFMQREPAGHGQHANPDRERRTPAAWWRTFQAGRDAPPPQTVTITYDDLDCFQPGSYASVLEVHHPKNVSVMNGDKLPALVDSPWRQAGPPARAQGGEPHHRDWTPRPLAAVRDGLAPWIEAAKAEDTAVDRSFIAAIRAHVDGDYTGQVVDRYFSQIDLRRIFADVGATYVAGAS